jgi:hypothetical protein
MNVESGSEDIDTDTPAPANDVVCLHEAVWMPTSMCEGLPVNRRTSTCPITCIHRIIYVTSCHISSCHIFGTSYMYSCIQVVEISGIKIRESDVEPVRSGGWLNDNIVDMYIWFLQAKADPTFFFMGSHFWTSLCNDMPRTINRWAKKERLLVCFYPNTQLLHLPCMLYTIYRVGMCMQLCAECIVWTDMHDARKFGRCNRQRCYHLLC